MPQVVVVAYRNNSDPQSVSLDTDDVSTWADILARCSSKIPNSPLFYARWAGQVQLNRNDYPVADADEYDHILAQAGKAGAEEPQLELNVPLE